VYSPLLNFSKFNPTELKVLADNVFGIFVLPPVTIEVGIGNG
jgi:hypothetical protein